MQRNVIVVERPLALAIVDQAHAAPVTVIRAATALTIRQFQSLSY